MKSQEIQKHINRIVGTEGTLRIPSWWMHKILSDLVKYCKENEGASVIIKEYVESQLNLVGKTIEDLDTKIENIESHELFEIVSELPYEPKDNTIYLIPSQNGEGNNVLTEWVYINSTWEQFGEFKADINLSEYAKKEDIHTPDWNASERESGYIANRTHSIKYKGSLINETSAQIENNTIKIDTASAVLNYGYFKLGECFDNSGKFIKYNDIINKKKVESFDGGAFEVSFIEDGGYLKITVVGTDNLDDIDWVRENILVYDNLKKLDDIFIPDTIARTFEIPTKLSQLEKDIELGSVAMIETTYSELKSLRDNSQLTPGVFYRITDYVTTTSQKNTQSAGHQFDIIVTADDEKTLNEEARACLHEGDTYFANSNLAAWELKYCLDNDTTRFAWIEPPAREGFADFIGRYVDDPVNGITPYSNDKESVVYDWDRLPHPDTGETTLVIYTQDPESYNEYGEPDYLDEYFYNGIVVVDGEEYDSWKKKDTDGWVKVEYNKSLHDVYAITERMVYDNELVFPIVENKGKGVIYYMKDEYNNEVSYDFKNIMFIKPQSDYFVFTFGTNTDDRSLSGRLENNIIKPYKIGYRLLINFIRIYGYDDCNNVFNDNCHNIEINGSNNTFGNECYNIFFGSGDRNVFGNNCYNITLDSYCDQNIFGHNCYANTLANDCCNNTFGNKCHNNVLQENCVNNTFGEQCVNNNLANECMYNLFDFDCNHIDLGTNCKDNYFASECSYIKFGRTCRYNVFGPNCKNISFRSGPSSNDVLLSHCQYNIFDSYCNNITIWNDTTLSSNNTLRRIHVKGVTGTNTETINITELHSDYMITVARNSAKEIKIYCEADLIA